MNYNQRLRDAERLEHNAYGWFRKGPCVFLVDFRSKKSIMFQDEIADQIHSELDALHKRSSFCYIRNIFDTLYPGDRFRDADEGFAMCCPHKLSLDDFTALYCDLGPGTFGSEDQFKRLDVNEKKAVRDFKEYWLATHG